VKLNRLRDKDHGMNRLNGLRDVMSVEF